MARGNRGNGGGLTPRWPGGEPAIPDRLPGKGFRDTCPEYEYPAGTPPPPCEREMEPCPPGELTPEEEHRICRLARQIAKENANYILNPYLFPQPFSEDFDIVGENVVTAAGPRFRVALFQIPKGYVGVLTAVGTSIPAVLQTNTLVHLVSNAATVKSFTSQTFAGAGAVAPAERGGVFYPLGTLLRPRPVFAALQDSDHIGIDLEVLAPGALQLPATMRGVVQGRFWPPSLASKYWVESRGA